MHFRRLLIALFVLQLLALVQPEPVEAQGVSTMLTCVQGHVDAAPFRKVGDPNPPVDRNWSQDVRVLLKLVHECGLQYAEDELVPIVRPWYHGILIIMIIWTGVTIMLGGSFAAPKLIGYIMLISFSYGLFEVYYSPTPVVNLFGVNRGLAHTIADGASAISDTIFATAGTAYLDAFELAEDVVKEQAEQFGSEPSTLTRVGTFLTFGFIGYLISEVISAYGSLEGALWAFGVTAIMWLLLGLYHLIYWIIMAQYMWGYFGLTVVSMFGPIFIPLILIPQLEDYFWGWLKALIQFAFYMIIGAGMFVVVSAILAGPLERLVNMQVPSDPDTGMTGLLEFGANIWTQYLPVIVTSLLASLQIGGLTSGLTSGSQMPAGGLLSRFTQLGAGIAAAGRGVEATRAGVAKYMGGGAPLSAETRRQRAAVHSAKEAYGQGGGPGGGAGGAGGGSPSGGMPTSQRATQQAFRRLRAAKTDAERTRLLDVWSRRIDAAYARD